MRLDFESLYTEAHADAFEGAKQWFYNNRVSDVLLSTHNDKVVVSATVAGRIEYRPKILFDSSGGLYDYSCNCSRNLLSDGPCKHILASALSFEERNPSKSENINKGSDAAALRLISHYAHSRERQISESEKQKISVLLIPGSDSLCLRLFIGSRRYKIKNIPAFLDRTRKREFFRYGIELAFYHGKEKLDQTSLKLYHLIESSLLEKSRLGITDPKKDTFMLLQNDVDIFFEIFDNQSVDVQTNVKSTVLVSPALDSLRLRLSVEKTSGGFKAYLRPNDIIIFRGRKFGYLLSESGIYKCSHQYLNTLLPLINMFLGRKSIFISQKDMGLFYNNVLFAVADYTQIESDTDLTIFEMPSLNAKLYLEPDGIFATARLECFYDDHKVDIFSDYYPDALPRDWHQESLLKKTIQKYFPSAPLLRLDQPDQIYNLIAFGLPEINKFAEIFVAKSSLFTLRRSPKIKVGVNLSGDLLDIDLQSEEFSSKDISDILWALKQNQEYVRLSDGSFVNLADPLFSSIKSINELSGSFTSNFSLPKFYAAYLDEQLSQGFLEYSRSNKFAAVLNDITLYETKNYAIPASLSSIMRNYQKSGFRWLKTLKENGMGGILADDMGLGKSLQIISLLVSENLFPCLIVCPTSLILNWLDELNKFAPQLKVLPIMGSAARADSISQIDKYQVVITSYKLLSRDIELYKPIDFSFLVADEAQFIKNPNTISSRAIKSLKSKFRFALSGTPIENNMSELWSIFDFIMPGYLGSYADYNKRFELPLLQGSKDAADQLLRLTSPFILRRMKSDILKELPPKIETQITVALEDQQRELYLKNLAAAKSLAAESSSKIAVLAQLTKLRQICCDPTIIEPDFNGSSAKTEACLELIQNAVDGGRKILLFSQFVSMLDILRQRLVQAGISHFLLKGDTPKPERMRLVKQFNSDDTSVFLISLKAGGTGLNLTGADVVILYDPWWNEAVMNQAIDRAYRIGQEKSVQVYKLILEDTIEQKILKLQQKKTALGSFVTSSPDSLSFEKIMEILE